MGVFIIRVRSFPLTKNTPGLTSFYWGVKPRMRSKGSRFTLGVWGLRVCSLDFAATVRNRSQPSATVRNRPREGRILLRRFQKMRCSFGGRRSTLEVSIVILRGRRCTLDVSRCVLLRIALSGLRQVATRCKFRGRRGILWDVMKIWWKLRTKHRFWGSKFGGS